MSTTTKPISLLACTLTPGTVLHEVTFTTKVGGLDLSGATSGRVRHVHPVDGETFWPLTVVGTPTARQAVLTHAMLTDDLDATEVDTAVPLRALVTVSGTEVMDGPEPYYMPVIA